MKTKKISWQAIAIVVLALVLIASIALGVSGAWFQDNDAVQQTSKMGEAVTIRLGNISATDPVTTWSGLYKDTKPFPGDTIMGNTNIYMGTETPSVVRGKIIVKVTDKNGTEVTVTAGGSLTKPTQPQKADYYEVVEGVTSFNQTGYDAAVKKYKEDAVAYDKQLLGDMLAVTLAGNTAWDKGVGEYYYLKTLATNEASIKLFDELKLSTDLSNEVAEWTISVQVVVEAIQAANIKESDWYADLAATTKTAADKYNTDRNVN